MTSLGRLCKRNECNLQRGRGRKKVHLLNHSFEPDKTTFVLSMHESIRKTLLHSQVLWGCSASHLPLHPASHKGCAIYKTFSMSPLIQADSVDSKYLTDEASINDIFTCRVSMANLSALFRLFPSASLLVAHLGLNPDPNPN